MIQITSDNIVMQLQHPEPVQILERYDADLNNEEEFPTEEERQLRREKSEKYKKLLAAHRYDSSCTDRNTVA